MFAGNCSDPGMLLKVMVNLTELRRVVVSPSLHTVKKASDEISVTCFAVGLSSILKGNRMM